MKRLLLAGLGATLYALLVALPLAHVSAWTGRTPGTAALALAALPVVAWAVAVARPSPWATLWLFPVSHVPVLVARPDLTGRLVYADADGLLALGAVMAVGAAWCAVALSRSTPREGRRPLLERRSAALPAATAVALAVVLAAFVAPILGGDSRPGTVPSQIAVLVGVAVAAHVAGRRVVGDLGDLWFDGGERERWLAAAMAERRPSPRVLWGSLLVAGALAGTVAFVYGF